MGRIYKIIFFCLLAYFITSTSVLAGQYDFEGTDPTGDVKDLLNNGNFTSNYQDLDITYAKVEDNGDNLVFTLQVLGKIIPDNSIIRYIFLVKSVGSSEYVELLFKNPYLSYVFRKIPYLSVDCEFELNDNEVVISAPKSAFADIGLPWEVTAKAKIYEVKDKFLDELLLSSASDDNGNGGNVDSNGNSEEIPSFEAIIIIIAEFMAVLVIIAIVVIVWSKKRRLK